MLVVVVVGDQVVDDAAGRVVAAQRVLRLAGLDLAQVVAQRRVDERRRARRRVTIALPRWLTSKIADRLADRGVLLDDARGVLQRHRPAAELRELRAERDVPVVQGRAAAGRASSLMARNLPQRPAPVPGWLSCPGDDLQPAQRQPRQDPCRRGGRRRRAARQGPRSSRRAARTSPRRTAASSGRCWPRSTSPARPARSPRCRPPARITSPLLILAGLGKRGRRRRPYAGPPAPPPARPPTPPRWRSRCPADTPELVRAVTEGYVLGGYTFTTYKKDPKSEHGAGHGHGAAARRAQAGRRPRPSRRRRSSRAPSVAHPRLGEHAARRPDASDVRRRRAATRSQQLDQGPRRAQGRDRRSYDERRARRARLRRHPRRRRRVRRAAPAGRAHLLPPRRQAAPRPGRQGHHLRLRRPDHQAGAGHERR